MKRLEKDFDLIVYDAPPLVGLADATLIAPHTDGLILVSRVNRCDRNVLEHAMDNISFTKIPILGLVANGVDTSGQSNKYYTYGYETKPQTTPQPQPKALAAATAAASTNGGTSHKSGLTMADFLKTGK